MKKIKICFTDFWKGFVEYKDYYRDFIKPLETRYEVIINDENPDYVFYSCFGSKHLEYKNAIKIFFTGECVCPNFNECDYAIGFDVLDFGDRYLRMPLFQFKFNGKEQILGKRMNVEKSKFCSFLVSNSSYAEKKRIDFFKLLSKYKKVDSGGDILNNISRNLGKKFEDKIEFIKDYKFNICFENTSHKGYATEKIVDAFYCGCIPIYYGDPDIGLYFNEKAFINCARYKNFDDVVQKVIEIDQNDEIRQAMLKEPILVKPLENKLDAFLYHIFDQDIKQAKRTLNRPIYPAPPIDNTKRNILHRFLSKIKHKIIK